MARKTKRRQQLEDEPTPDVQDWAAPSELPAGETEPGGEETLEYTELVLLVHANNLPEAELFKAELQAHGIPALLEGEGVVFGEGAEHPFRPGDVIYVAPGEEHQFIAGPNGHVAFLCLIPAKVS